MLTLRQLRIEDEHSFRNAVQEFSQEFPPWEFAFKYDPAEDFCVYVDRVNSWPQGVEGFVPSSYLVAIVDEKIVGRVSIRHKLNDFLKQYGGHVGYGVVRSERRKGYATEILRQSLSVCRVLGLNRIMVSCDVDNEGSKKVIEKNGGVFERQTNLNDLEKQKFIYWIETKGCNGERLTPLAAHGLDFRRQPHITDMELHELADRVNSKETFLEFVAALRADWEASRAEESAQPSSPYSPAAHGWENPDLGSFLEAMHAWTDDMGDQVVLRPGWRTFADMLMAAKIYE